MSSPFRLEQLDTRHDVAHFRSGRASIDSYLQERAFVEQSLGLSHVTVAVERDAPVHGSTASIPLVGFFTLSPTSIRVAAQLLKTLGIPGVQYPALGGYLLGRLGVHDNMQGKGIGSALVAAAVKYAEMGKVGGVGGAFVAVDAEDETLVPFYSNLGFHRIEPTRLRMVMRI